MRNLIHSILQGGNAKVKETTEEIINIGQLMRQHEEDLNKEVENDKEAVDDKDKEEDVHDTVDSLAGGRNHGVPDEEPSSSKGAPGVDKIDEIKWNIEKENRQQTIYNLITKSRYHHKPRLCDIEASLIHMKHDMLANNETKLAMPRRHGSHTKWAQWTGVPKWR